MKYGIQFKQQQSTTVNNSPYNTYNTYDNIKSDCSNTNPTFAKWFGGSSAASYGGSSPFSFGAPKPFVGTASGFGQASSFNGLGQKPKLEMNDQKEKEPQTIVKKDMTFEDRYRLSPVTKFLGFIEISGSIYPMYNFHQCFDSSKLPTPYSSPAPSKIAELKSLLSINNISQTLKEKFFMKEFTERENKDGVMEKVCIVEVINDDLDKLCALLEKRQIERENDGNYDESKPLWTNNVDEDDKANLLHQRSMAFLEFLLMSLQCLDNFKRYEVVDGSFVHL
jgi:hypothetical protein